MLSNRYSHSLLAGKQNGKATLEEIGRALLLLGPMESEACASKMNLICEMVAVPYEIDGNTVSVGASCGYALYPAESVDVQQVRYIADQRMYENKQANHARQDGAESI